MALAPQTSPSDDKGAVSMAASEAPSYKDGSVPHSDPLHTTDDGAAPSGVRGKVVAFYSKAMSQVALVGFACFLCPGMFNALSGIGGGGQVDTTASTNSNAALYACFSVFSFFAGSIHNKLGTRLTLFLGACGYSLYIASFLSYNHNQNKGFVIAAGAVLGICASLFWTAQGAVMLSYPTEQSKSKAFALVWIIFNLGAVIGSAIELGLTYDSEDTSLGDAVYAVFLVLTFLGACVAALLKPPGTVIRADGTRVHVPEQTTWAAEFQGLWRVLKADPFILFLFPLFFASNFFYTWQQQNYNAVLFTLRTRALNSLIYWLAQMVAAYLISLLLDSTRLPRRTRMWAGWAVVFSVLWAVWGGSYAKQLDYVRGQEVARIDLSQSRAYAGPGLLYAFSGFFDALWQAYAYALIGAISNDMSKLAIIAGFYKSIQSAGAAGAFGLDSAKHPYMTILGTTWGLCAAGMVLALPVLVLRIKNHTDPLSEVTAPGREFEVKAAMEEAIERTGDVPLPLQAEKDELKGDANAKA